MAAGSAKVRAFKRRMAKEKIYSECRQHWNRVFDFAEATGTLDMLFESILALNQPYKKDAFVQLLPYQKFGFEWIRSMQLSENTSTPMKFGYLSFDNTFEYTKNPWTRV